MELTKIGEKDDLIRLKSDAGETGWFRFLELVACRGKEYAALADAEDELIVMELIEADGKTPERYLEITDDAEFEAVLQALDAAEE